jgi:tRNA(Leu) C34 or U34 (ribose-2'-O)-methylase TrmL
MTALLAQTKRATRALRTGYFGIGIYNPKFPSNMGTLWRSATILGASYTFQVGDRFRRECTDTIKAWRHVPHIVYSDADAFFAAQPYDSQVVAVELDDAATPVESFVHPDRAVYLLGAEDSGIPRKVLDRCQAVVQLPGVFCMNVSAAGSVVMYDRHAKRAKQ